MFVNEIKIPKESKRFQFNKIDLLKILKGTGIAAFGAAATYALVEFREMDFGQYTPFVVMGLSILGNILRKFVAGRK